jgi:hypothetical protein
VANDQHGCFRFTFPAIVGHRIAVIEAYDIRSRLLHDGTVDMDYTAYMAIIESIYREIFAFKLKLPLRHSSFRQGNV